MAVRLTAGEQLGGQERMTTTATVTMQAERQEGMPARFDGKVGVVTGGASGIGEGIVRRLVEEGGRCLIADVQEDRGRALARDLASDEAWYVNGACLVVDAASEVPGSKARRYFETASG